MAEVAIFKRKNCIFSALDLCNRIILYNTKQHVIGERLTQCTCISDWVNSKKSTSGGLYVDMGHAGMGYSEK